MTMMPQTSLSDGQLLRLIQARKRDSANASDELKKRYDANMKALKNAPDWVSSVAKKRSTARLPRLTMAVETITNFVIARPAQLNTLPADGESDDAKTIADNVQDVLFEKNKDRKVKGKMRIAFRNTLLSRLFVIKICWNHKLNDWQLKNVDPRKVRIPKNASCEEEAGFIFEEVEEPAADLLSRVDEKTQEKILRKLGGKSYEDAVVENADCKYDECWLTAGDEDLLVLVWDNEIISRSANPYFDFTGVGLTDQEATTLGNTYGQERRRTLTGAKVRSMEEQSKLPKRTFFNFFDRPRKPYVFGSLFKTTDGPEGAYDIFDLGFPLQENIDKRKRQIADNADDANSLWKIDSEKTGLTKQDAAEIQAEVSGYIVAKGATEGVKRETGEGLPQMVFSDLENSINQLDELLGVPDILRGVAERQETAQGRLILREQAVGRLEEYLSLVEEMYRGVYEWQLHFIKLRYTTEHFEKVIGADRAAKTVGLLQDDIDDGMEIRVVEGQTIPEDMAYRMARAQEAYKAQTISPLQYLRDTGWENPEKVLKEAVMWQQNPMGLLNFTDEELAKLGAGAPGTPAGAGTEGEDAKLAATRDAQIQRAQQILSSEEFKKLPPEEQARVADELEREFPELKQR